MKNEAVHAKKLATLLKRLRHGTKAEPPPARDPVTQMVVAFLEWDATPKAAREAHTRIMAVLVDNNDLRVSHPHELMELLGPKYPRAQERAARMHESLQEIFVREHAVSLEHLATKPKKQARTYLDTLPGMTPYVAAQVMLLSLGGHAVPVDDTLAELLRREDAVDASATVDDIGAYLERQVKPGEALEVHLALQAWSAASGSALRSSAKPSTGSAPGSSSAPASGGGGKRPNKAAAKH